MKPLMLACVLVFAASCVQGQPIEWTRDTLKSVECPSIVMVKCDRESDSSGRIPAAGQTGALGVWGTETWDVLQQRRFTFDEWRLGLVIVEGERIRQPGLREIFERNLPSSESIRFATSDLGDGRRCTFVLPFGYRECTSPVDRAVSSLGMYSTRAVESSR